MNEGYKQSIIELFNKVLTDEVSASIAYSKMSELSTSPKLSEELASHADDEYRHMKDLLKFAYAHGFGSEVDVSIDKAITMNVSAESALIIEVTQELERIAIEDYTRGVLLARENNDIEMEEFLKALLKEEQGHFDEIAKLYGGTRPIGSFSNYIKSLGGF